MKEISSRTKRQNQKDPSVRREEAEDLVKGTGVESLNVEKMYFPKMNFYGFFI